MDNALCRQGALHSSSSPREGSMKMGRVGVALAVACAISLVPGVAEAAPWGPHTVPLTESALEGVHGTSPDATVRNVLTVTAAGAGLRIRLSNPFADTPVVVRSVWAGLQRSPESPALVTGSGHRATFHGARAITLRPGASEWTDPMPLAVRLGDHVSVSIYAPGAPVDDHTFPPPETDTPGSFLSTAPGVSVSG